jgi:dethiobiotin synthetase
MQLPVLVVALNRFGCLNHTILTVRSVIGHGLVCAGVVLNAPQGVGDIASRTKADILRQALDVRIVSSLPEETTGLSAEWSAITGFSATPVIP